MSKQPPPAPIASTIGPCLTIIQIVGRPGSASLHHPTPHPVLLNNNCEDIINQCQIIKFLI